MTSASAGPGLRADLDAIVSGALASVDPETLVRRELSRASWVEASPERSPDIVLAAVGKAARGMARGALDVLGSRVGRAVIVEPRGNVRHGGTVATGSKVPSEPTAAGRLSAPRRPGAGAGAEGIDGAGRADGIDLDGVRVVEAGHPFPDEGSLEGGRAVLDLVRTAPTRHRIVFLLSGGASALLTFPPDGLSLNEVGNTARLLMEAGADIGELNTVRKHLDRVKGGRLARAAAPTPLWAGILSDVVGDRMDVIGSGPVSPDPTTFGDALEVVHRRIPGRVPPAVLEHLERGGRGEVSETPSRGDPCFDTVVARIVGNARTAMAGAAGSARELGYEVREGSPAITGDARAVGRDLGRTALRLSREAEERGRGLCHLSAGETTVTVTGDGRGGPNQEVALSAALELAASDWAADSIPASGLPRENTHVLVASVGTDGIDGPTDVAGAVADPSTIRRAHLSGLDPEALLRDNDSHRLFDALGDHVRTGPTGTNVMDLHVVLVRSVRSSKVGEDRMD